MLYHFGRYLLDICIRKLKKVPIEGDVHRNVYDTCIFFRGFSSQSNLQATWRMPSLHNEDPLFTMGCSWN
ncbi:hypothetical protein CDL15_Pgr002632 [Punica granatum]|uniref:Uncharacterized protein n=1 Tax=Punica granatum TaxID=22663 RepID=A0A218W1X5_PUNGR|nr:hypothetical protein CDL15_Pgr002632 [Punica granatum]